MRTGPGGWLPEFGPSVDAVGGLVSTVSESDRQPVVAEVMQVVMRAARFVAGEAADASVDGLPLEPGVGGADLGDDVAA